MTDNENYFGIDIGKFIFAIVVVSIHTELFTIFSIYTDIAYYVTAIAVPFFFIASGFFFARLYSKGGSSITKKNTNNIIRLSKMYLMWGGVYFFLGILTGVYKGEELLSTILSSLHAFCVGTPGGGMWYLSSLILSLALLSLILKTRKQELLLLVTLVGFLISAYPNIQEILGAENTFDTIYLRIFITYRSVFFNYIYVFLGFLIWYKQDKIKTIYHVVYIVIFVIMSKIVLAECNTSVLMQLFVQYARVFYFVSWFAIFMRLGNKISINTIKFREFSSIIYFSHVAFITVYKVIVPLFIDADNQLYVVILFIFTMTTLFAWYLILDTMPQLKKFLYR